MRRIIFIICLCAVGLYGQPVQVLVAGTDFFQTNMENFCAAMGNYNVETKMLVNPGHNNFISELRNFFRPEANFKTIIIVSHGKCYNQATAIAHSGFRSSSKAYADIREDQAHIANEGTFNCVNYNYRPVNLFDLRIHCQVASMLIYNTFHYTETDSAWGEKYLPKDLTKRVSDIERVRYFVKGDKNRDLKLKDPWVEDTLDDDGNCVFDGRDIASEIVDSTLWKFIDLNKNGIPDRIFAVHFSAGWGLGVDLDGEDVDRPNAYDFDNDGFFDIVDANDDCDYNDFIEFPAYYQLDFDKTSANAWISAQELGAVASELKGNVALCVFDCYSGQIHKYFCGPNRASFSSCGKFEETFGGAALDQFSEVLFSNGHKFISMFRLASEAQKIYSRSNLFGGECFYLNDDGNSEPTKVSEAGHSDGNLSDNIIFTPKFITEVEVTPLALGTPVLSNAYPNPFNASTKIHYQLPNDCHVKIEIFNLLGQRVTVLVDGEQNAGGHDLVWRTGGVSTGVHFLVMTAGDFRVTQRMMLLK